MATYYAPPMNCSMPITPPYSAQYDGHFRHDSFAATMPVSNYHPSNGAEYPLGFNLPSVNLDQPRSGDLFEHAQNLPPINSYYDRMGAPILPPLRMKNTGPSGTDYHALDQPPCYAVNAYQGLPKDQPATGGVSAKLDYDMDRMTDFVAGAAQKIILQVTTLVDPAFRKWVNQVLCATRLPSATILLGLHYLTVRLKEFSSTIEKTESQLYRLLCVSLILGSKFLDDNTFINRSWSDVSGIKVSELNSLEIRWLALIGFDLHADAQDPHGVSLWLQAWRDYDVQREEVKIQTRLAPLDNFRVRSTNRHYYRPECAPQYDNSINTTRQTFTPMSLASYPSPATSPYVSADPWNRYDNQSGRWYDQGRLSSARTPSLNTYYGEAQVNSPAYQQFCLPPLHSLTSPSYYDPWIRHSWDHAPAYGYERSSYSRTPAMGPHFSAQPVAG